jgi:hypothetical protein
MRSFLKKLELRFEHMEKLFDDDVKLQTSLNQFFIEYEQNSSVTYSS